MEKGLQPPPALDRLAARSLQRLQEEVQQIKFQPLIHRVDENIFWLRLWFQLGILMIGLMLTGRWTIFKVLLRRQSKRPSYINRRLELDFASRQRELSVSESALWRSYGLSPATTTGVNIEEGQVTKLRHRNRTLASEAKTVPTPDILAGGHLAANNRAAAPAGKQRIEKERKRREKELKKNEIEDIGWKVPRDFILTTNPMSALILRWWRNWTSREMGEDKEKRSQGRFH